MKLLNLDELSQIPRKVVLKGVEYEVVEMSVGAFIDAMKKAKEIEQRVAGGEDISPEEQMDSMIDAVLVALPSCPKDVLRGISFGQLTTLVKFINGELDNESKEQEGGEPKKS